MILLSVALLLQPLIIIAAIMSSNQNVLCVLISLYDISAKIAKGFINYALFSPIMRYIYL
jgi:hypothetical protein